jgi:pentatricopeptide repeat protein
LNQLRINERLDKVNIARLASYLKSAVNHGEAVKLSQVWKEYKNRLLDPSESEKHRHEIYAKILSACLRCERRYHMEPLPETIQDMMANIPQPMPTGIFNVILASRANMDDGDADLPEQEIGISDFSRRSVERGQLGSVWKSAAKQGITKDVKSYMIYIEGLGRTGDLDQFQAVWNEFVKDEKCREACGDGQWPPISAFNHMLSAAFVIGKVGPPFALDLFEKARQPGSTTPINMITINIVLRHHARMSDVSAMTSLFNLASQLNFEPDIITYTTLVQGLLRANQIDRAKSVLDQMASKNMEPNERLCSMLIADLSKYGSRKGLIRAEEMVSQMRRKNMKVTVQAWTSLISGYFRGGWEKDAWSTVNRMDSYGVRLNRVGYNILLQEGRHSRFDTVGESWPLKVFRRMVKDGVIPNDDTYLILLGPMVEKERWTEADLVLAEMRRLRYYPTRGAVTSLVRSIHARNRKSR